jgi:hypothetical protein
MSRASRAQHTGADGGCERSASRSDVETSHGRVSIFQTRKRGFNDRDRWSGVVHGHGGWAGPSAAGSIGDGPVVILRDDAPAVSRAQASLDVARNELDAALMSLGDRTAGDTVMADPSLVSLLLRVTTARRHLADVTRPALAPTSLD